MCVCDVKLYDFQQNIKRKIRALPPHHKSTAFAEVISFNNESQAIKTEYISGMEVVCISKF